MALFDWFRRKTPLQRALERGLQNGNLTEEIRELGDLSIKSGADAQAVCTALEETLNQPTPTGCVFTSPARTLIGLFQRTEGQQAYDAFREVGLPLIEKAVDRRSTAILSDDDLLFALKVLAMFGTPSGTDAVVKAVRAGFKADGYMWNVILGVYDQEHPQTRRLYAELSKPLPDEFIAVSLLDSANHFFLAGGDAIHPFDSEEGVSRLKRWISDSNEDHFSYAVSAVVALPFLNHGRRDELLFAAMKHPSPDVRLESGWAAAKLDRAEGLDKLVRMCLDINSSSKAANYLRELKREDLIPAEASAPEFAAKAEFSQWLAHPNELGRPPDAVELYDTRVLRWPPEFEARHFWLLKYRVANTSGLEPDDVGIGLVGSITWCFFGYDLTQRPPEDCYALHVCWEAEQQNAMEFADVSKGGDGYETLLAEWKGRPLSKPQILHVVEVDPGLKYPQRLVGVASAELDGQSGWVVLDGTRSRWYSAREFPQDESAKAVLKIHVGRQLLALPLEANDRESSLHPKPVTPDEIFVAAYERLIVTCESDSAQRVKDQSSRDLRKHFSRFVTAAANLRNLPPPEVLIATYRRLLILAETEPSLPAKDPFDSLTPVGEHFDSYVDALVELGRGGEAASLIQKLVPIWDHNRGYGQIGRAAFQIGDHDLAEASLLKLKSGQDAWHRSAEMTHLAEIWIARNKLEDAKQLLADATRRCSDEAANAEGSDIEFFDKILTRLRSDNLRLFP